MCLRKYSGDQAGVDLPTLPNNLYSSQFSNWLRWYENNVNYTDFLFLYSLRLPEFVNQTAFSGMVEDNLATLSVAEVKKSVVTEMPYKIQ